MKTKSAVVGGVILAVLLLVSSSAQADREYTFSYEKEVPSQGVSKVYIDNAAGEVRLKPALQKDKIAVKAEKVIYDDDERDAREQAEEVQIEVEKIGSTLRIETHYPRYHRRSRSFLKQLLGDWGRSQHVEYRIFLPQDIDIEVSTSSADVSGERLKNNLKVDGSSSDIFLEKHRGEVSVEVSSGDLELVDGEGDVYLEGSSSDVYIDHLKGDVFIDNTSGDIRTYNLEGDLTIDNSSGDLHMKDSHGQLKISTSSGDVSVRDHRGVVDIHSSSGDLEVELTSMEGKRHRLETSSGDVRLDLPEDLDSWITVETTSGEIRSHLSLEASSISERNLRGRVGSGDSEIEIYTVSGDIGLNRR